MFSITSAGSLVRSGDPLVRERPGASVTNSRPSLCHSVTLSLLTTAVMFQTLSWFSGDSSSVAEQHGHPAAEPEPRGGAAVQRGLSRFPLLRGPSEEGAGGGGDDGQVPGGGGEV